MWKILVNPHTFSHNLSLELTGLSWSFAGLEQVATEVGERGLRAWAALQLSLDR